jgi:hypothetical protein
VLRFIGKYQGWLWWPDFLSLAKFKNYFSSGASLFKVSYNISKAEKNGLFDAH